MTNSFAQFFGEKTLSDVAVLIPGDRRIHCHKPVLSARSTHFKNLFSRRIKGCSSREVEYGAPVFDVSTENAEVALKFLYTGVLHPDDGCGVKESRNRYGQMIRPAQHYDIASLSEAVIKVVLDMLQAEWNWHDFHEILHALTWCDLHQLFPHQAQLLAVREKNLLHLMALEQFQILLRDHQYLSHAVLQMVYNKTPNLRQCCKSCTISKKEDSAIEPACTVCGEHLYDFISSDSD